jgi:hypothetical protein
MSMTISVRSTKAGLASSMICLRGASVANLKSSCTSQGGASAGLFSAGRSLDCRANLTTSATARSKTDDQYDGSMGDEFRCASARRFDGVVRSILTVVPPENPVRDDVQVDVW